MHEIALLAADAHGGGITGWVIGYVVTGVVVLVVVTLVLPILLLARAIGRDAARIDEQLVRAVDNTAALHQLNTTIEHARVITAGLRRGRARLGG